MMLTNIGSDRLSLERNSMDNTLWDKDKESRASDML